MLHSQWELLEPVDGVLYRGQKLSSNYYPSTYADVMHKSILVCFCAPQCT